MKRLKRVGAVVVVGCMSLWNAMSVSAIEATLTPNSDGSMTVEMNVLNGVNSIEDLLKLVVNILMYGLGAAAVVGTVIAGILYLTARDNEQQIATAKRRLIEIAIGLLVWALLFSALKWLIPGFSSSTNVLN